MPLRKINLDPSCKTLIAKVWRLIETMNEPFRAKDVVIEGLDKAAIQQAVFTLARNHHLVRVGLNQQEMTFRKATPTDLFDEFPPEHSSQKWLVARLRKLEKDCRTARMSGLAVDMAKMLAEVQVVAKDMAAGIQRMR